MVGRAWGDRADRDDAAATRVGTRPHHVSRGRTYRPRRDQRGPHVSVIRL